VHDRPTWQELLDTVAALLRDEAAPQAESRLRYQLLVALHLLETVRRERELAPSQLRVELARLRALPGLEQPRGPAPVPGDDPDEAALAESVREGNERLCAAIRAGAFAAGPSRAALLAHLRATVADKLRVANPRFLARVESEG
jgi:hypothetical protein